MFSDKRTMTVLLILNGLLLAALIGVEIGGGLWAQAPGASERPTIALAVSAPDPNEDQPIYVVDTRNEVICIYEQNVGTRKFGLIAARTYKYDKQLLEFQNQRPSVEDVKSGRYMSSGRPGR